jgi:hypothetical protein
MPYSDGQWIPAGMPCRVPVETNNVSELLTGEALVPLLYEVQRRSVFTLIL